MRSRTIAAVCACVVTLWSCPAPADTVDVRPFKGKLIRPVPGHTLVCRSQTHIVGRSVPSGSYVIAVEPDGNGSRLTFLTKDGLSEKVEIALRFDAQGAVRGEPSVKQGGKTVDVVTAGVMAQEFIRWGEQSPYSGRPLSSGDTFKRTPNEVGVQAIFDRLSPGMARVDKWIEVGRVAGSFDDRQLGELVAVDWIGQSVAAINGVDMVMAIRTREYYDVSSGLMVWRDMRMTYAARNGYELVRARDELLCGYVAHS